MRYENARVDTNLMKVLVVVGTRPEAIKMAPVIRRLAAEPDCVVRVCATAQHRQMLDQAFSLFGITPDIDLDLMRPDQTPNALASRVFAALDGTLAEEAPDWLLVQGDTTTAMCASVAAFHRRVRVGHVEAGLRTGDFQHPFPEEMNRRVADLIADVHFVPTRRAAQALEAENVPAGRIFLTGNTVVDALVEIAGREGDLPEEDLVLITAHRRESFGEPLERIVRAIGRLAHEFPSTRFVHVTHPNPNVARVVRRNEGLPNVQLVEPVDYGELVRLMRRSRLILTDSGGIQEEAPTFRTSRSWCCARRPSGPRVSRRAWPGWSEPTRSASSSRRARFCPTPRPGAAWPGARTRTATASPRIESRRSCCSGPSRRSCRPHETALGVGLARAHLLARPPHVPALLAARPAPAGRGRETPGAREAGARAREALRGSGPPGRRALRRARPAGDSVELPEAAPAAALRGARPCGTARLLRFARRVAGSPAEPVGVAPGVTLLPIAGVRREDPWDRRLNPRAAARASSSLVAARARFEIQDAVLLVQSPFWAPLCESLRRHLGWSIVYDCLDAHPEFPTSRPDVLIDAEARLAASADLVVATSESLRRRLEPRNASARLLPNACDFSLFGDLPLPAPEADRLTVGYVGALDSWFDFDLLRRLAQREPLWRFEIVGGVEDASADLPRTPNLVFHGERPHRELPELLRRFDVEIIPFRLSPLTHATDPVKLYEAAAAGRSVVATPMRSLEELARRGLVRLAATPEEFSREIRAAAKEAEAGEVGRRLRAFARENTWDVRARALDGWLDELRAAQAKGAARE